MFSPRFARALALALAVVVAPASPLLAQSSTSDLERRARDAYAQNDLPLATRLYRELASQASDPQTRSSHLVRAAWLEHQSGAPAKARSSLEEALLADPEHEFQGALYSEAFVAIYREVVDALQRNRQARLEGDITRAARALTEGRLDEAGRLLDTVLAGDPRNVRALYNRALVASRTGDDERALTLFQRIDALAAQGDVDPAVHARALVGLGQAFLSRSGVADAEDSLLRALELQPDLEEAWLTLARGYLAADQLERALETYTRAESRLGRTFGLERATALSGLGRHREAVDLLLAELERAPRGASPRRSEIFERLGQAQAAAGDTVAATRTLQRLLDELTSQSADFTGAGSRAAERLARLALDRGDAKAAEGYSRQAIERSTSPSSNAWTLFGLAVLEQGHAPLAVTAFKNALSLTPDDPIVLNNLGNAYYSLGEAQPAIEAFERALLLDPTFATARTNLEAARSAPVQRAPPARRSGSQQATAQGILLEDARVPSLQRPAARVKALDDASRAAGLQLGDLILRIGGQPVVDANDALRKLNAARGDFRIDLVRAGETLSISATRRAP